MAQTRKAQRKRSNMERHSAEFQVERKLFENSKQEWLRIHADEFVVISGNSVAGFYKSFPEAFDSAIRTLGSDSKFLIKEVAACEHVFVLY